MQTTVIVTTVGGPWLSDQLAALAVQTRGPDQLVVVNNGPAGSVDAVLERWRGDLPGLELVEDRSMSVCGFARNVGAARARYPGLLFLDDDDVVNPGYLEAMSDALDHDEIVAARIDVDSLNPASLTNRWGDMQSDGPMNYHAFLPWVIGGALGVRRENFLEVGGFDSDFLVGEDTDFCWRILLRGSAEVGFVPDAVLSYRLRSRVRQAFHQARRWAFWDVAIYRRYRELGMPRPANQVRALVRWARPVVLLLHARRSDDVVVAARQLGSCMGRAQGSVAHRVLFL